MIFNNKNIHLSKRRFAAFIIFLFSGIITLVFVAPTSWPIILLFNSTTSILTYLLTATLGASKKSSVIAAGTIFAYLCLTALLGFDILNTVLLLAAALIIHATVS